MKYPTRLIAAALIGLFFVTACGQKGPLFLPGNPSEIRPQPPQQEQTDDEEDEEEEETAPR